jgi:hypothetical protein
MHLLSITAELGRTGRTMVAIATIAGLSAGPVTAQSISQKVAQRGNGVVRMSFPAKDGVCPMGGGGRYMGFAGYYYGGIGYDSDEEEWDNGCKGETVLVALSVRDGKPLYVRTYVGGKWKGQGDSITDMGAVPPETAANYLFSIAVESPHTERGSALHAASLAAGVTLWPQILEVVQDKGRSKELRTSAIGWLGRSGGEKVTSALASIVMNDSEDRKVRESAINALASRPNNAGVNSLIQYVKSGKDSHLRAVALNHLTRNKDPRVSALVEDLVTGKE